MRYSHAPIVDSDLHLHANCVKHFVLYPLNMCRLFCGHPEVVPKIIALLAPYQSLKSFAHHLDVHMKNKSDLHKNWHYGFTGTQACDMASTQALPLILKAIFDVLNDERESLFNAFQFC